MGEFVDVALSFPTVLFSFLVIVVVGYWLCAAFGIADLDQSHVVGAGIPLPIVLSVMIVVTWFTALAGVVLTQRVLTGTILIKFAVLAGAVLIGAVVTRLTVIPLRRLFAATPVASRGDFVGRTCVIRTGTVTQTFGQAEVTAADGSSAVVQVRQPGQDELTNGTVAVIFDYDSDGEFFWVAPVDFNSSRFN